MRHKIFALSISVFLSAMCADRATACDQLQICNHIIWCLTTPTIDPNDVKNLNWSIDVNSGTNIRFNTNKCQESRGTNEGKKHWRDDEQICSDGDLEGAGQNARRHANAGQQRCDAAPPPPPPAPAPGQSPGHQNTCVLPSGVSCSTKLPMGSSCQCNGEIGRVH
jgi:hypothetical protein